MMFLLFIASIAVMEFLVRDTGRKSHSEFGAATIGKPNPVTPANEASTSDLLALGRALAGSTKTIDSEDVGAVDRVKIPVE
jgi:hypothetical protein